MKNPQPKKMKILFWLGGAVIGPFLALYLFYVIFTGPYASWIYLRRAIPEKIQTSWVVAYGDNTPLMQLRYEGCGAVIYKLTKNSADEIKRNGISYFSKDMIGEHYRHSNKSKYYTWGEWKETPDPAVLSDGFYPGVYCLFKNKKSKLESDVFNAMSKKGSYYSRKHEAVLYVFPDLEMVVYAYFG